MDRQLTSNDFHESMADHVAAKAAEARDKYGPTIGPSELRRILDDRSVVRYPCEIIFDDSLLKEGEFAHPVPLGEHPQEGFQMAVNPHFASRPEAVVALVLYQIVLVNYGDFASPDNAETFGAGVLGLDRERYYQMVCSLADELAPPSPSSGCSCGMGSGGC